ncbi:MAG: Gfo/Idh/MocA family oxidoreductase [Candidatus Aminicenantes bacterium]|nr:MAG: Gfo/Idh/MocA family oxidoreductase [Candidatus Aminicenantes bacterium]
MRRLKFGLVGCGRILKKHAGTLTGALKEKAELAAVCDIKPQRAKTAGETYKVPYFTSYDEMLETIDVDVVTILTESGNHARHTIDIVKKYRKHIVVEKPMALLLDDADRMNQACDEAGVKLFVVKQNRYNLPVMKLREALEIGRFGKLVMGTVRVRWSRTQQYYDQDAWRGTWAMDGGVFANQASHHIDLLKWMLGNPISVFAKGAAQLVKIETEDTGAAIITFENGAFGIVEATTATRPKDLEGSLSILGEKGTVEIGGFAVNEMKVWNFQDQQPGDEEVLEKYRQNPADVYGFGHIKYLENVIDTINQKEMALVDGLEGRKSLELISAIYESIETGKEVYLRFRPSRCRLGL